MKVSSISLLVRKLTFSMVFSATVFEWVNIGHVFLKYFWVITKTRKVLHKCNPFIYFSYYYIYLQYILLHCGTWHIGLPSDTDRHLSIQFDACIQDLVRFVALTRLVYGDGHLKLAQAHARLAKAYFQFKGKFRKTEYIVNYHLRLICKEYGNILYILV